MELLAMVPVCDHELVRLVWTALMPALLILAALSRLSVLSISTGSLAASTTISKVGMMM